MASSAPEQKPTSSASQQAQWSLQPLAASQVEEAHSLEAAGYPADEGASVEKLKWRQEHAGDFFFSCIGREERNEGAVLGFICSTVVTGPLTEEGMGFVHSADGDNLCIHSVCVSANEQRRGIASAMMSAYLVHVSGLKKTKYPNLKKISLICKEHLVGLYKKAGFVLVGPSSIVHGEDVWYDMDMDVVGA